jgi:hypothetical protein
MSEVGGDNMMMMELKFSGLTPSKSLSDAIIGMNFNGYNFV